MGFIRVSKLIPVRDCGKQACVKENLGCIAVASEFSAGDFSGGPVVKSLL